MGTKKTKKPKAKSMGQVCCEGYGSFGWDKQTAYAKRCWNSAAAAVINEACIRVSKTK